MADCDRMQLGEEGGNNWRTYINTVVANFITYQNGFSSILTQLAPSNTTPQVAQPNNFQHEQLKLMKEQNELFKMNSEATQKGADKVAKEKKEAAIKKAMSKCDTIIEDAAELSKKVEKYDDWKAQSDLIITREMKDNENQRKELQKIVDLSRELDDLVAENNLSDARDGLKIQEADTKLQEVAMALEEKIKVIEEEDKIRELYSLDEIHVDKVKLPTYSGKYSEDYQKFKEDLTKAFVHNRITRADKLSKLRECLSGQAKYYVPESITDDIDKAWKALDKAYGDPIRLMRFRKQKIFKLGAMPKETDKGGWKKQVEWLIEMEGLLQSLLDLGLKDSKCGEEIFPEKEWMELLGMFPTSLGNKLLDCPGTHSDKIKSMISKISQFRNRAQEWQLVSEVVNDKGRKL